MKTKRNIKDNIRITSFALGPLSVTLGDLGGHYGLHLEWRRKKEAYILSAIVLRFGKAKA